MKDEKTLLIELTSHAKASDVSAFKRKVNLYMEVAGRKPDRLILITPYADERAKEACRE